MSVREASPGMRDRCGDTEADVLRTIYAPRWSAGLQLCFLFPTLYSSDLNQKRQGVKDE